MRISRPPLARDLVVVGASAGGVQALQTLVRGLPSRFAASVLIVVHVSPIADSILPKLLQQAGALPAQHARNGERFERGRIYVAPPDHHLMVKPDGRLAVSQRGPRENGFRPAIDPLFRTAARSYGPRVIGVVLTGGLDDGTLGLSHIKEHGGTALVQDPAEAFFSSMPRSAIRHVEVDHILPVARMPPLLAELVREPLHQDASTTIEHTDRTDQPADVAEAGRASLPAERDPGPPTNIICPECGGTLWELKDRRLTRYECHVGHSYTAESLLDGKATELEGALWAALRALEENAELRRRMAARMANAPLALQGMREELEHRAQQATARASVLRTMLGDDQAAARLAQFMTAEREAADAIGNESAGAAERERVSREGGVQ